MSETSSVEKPTNRILKTFGYEKRPVVHGYANRTLYIDLQRGIIQSKPVEENMKELFTGGRGFCLWLLWNAVKETTKWNDPENELVIAGGPIGGVTAYPGSGKCTVVSISPLTHAVIDSNSGGYFGPYLKFAGWDAIEIQGKAQKDVVIVIDGDEGKVWIEEAGDFGSNTHLINEHLTRRFAANEQEMRGISVVSAGRAADHVAMGCLNISYYDMRRRQVKIKQAARGGTGRVLRDKKIKAFVVKFTKIGADNNGCADIELVRRAGRRINKEIADFDLVQNDMGNTGTPYLVEIMSKFDLLPIQNFRFGSDARASDISGEVWKAKFDHSGPDGCWYGCTLACAHGIPNFTLRTGPYKGQKVFVDGPEYETIGALGTNNDIFNPADIAEMNFYCDTYGIDTISCGNSIAFAMECFENGILNLERTGGMDLQWGNASAAIELIHQMARGEGFGMVVGQGIRFMRLKFASDFGADPQTLRDIGMEVKGLEISDYISKESLAQQGGYAMASKGPQHDEAWLIFMEMVHKQLPTFKDKAEALYYFPIWRTWFSLHGLCKLPWNDIIPASNKAAEEPAKVPEHIENYTWLYKGVTGKSVSIHDLMQQSERVYQFQRIFNLRLGFGRRKDDYPPYRAMGPVTEKEYLSRQERYDKQLKEEVNAHPEVMSTKQKVSALRQFRQDQYEQLLDAVYERRGWTKDGIPTIATLKKIHMDLPELARVINENSKGDISDEKR
jgi:aldehyde:ferredoxin oxidoreductase